MENCSYSEISISISLFVLIISSLFSASSSYAQPNSSECTVHIVGGLPNMYSGQYVHLIANVTGSEPQNLTWHVEGPIIKDYDSNIYSSKYLTASLNIDPPTFMSPADFKNTNISFYWQPNQTDTIRNVNVEVKTPNGHCKDSKDYTVTRNNNNIDLQAEDFYVETNHPVNITDENDRRLTEVLDQHNQWHTDFNFNNMSYTYDPEMFFDFHRSYIAHFDAWRKLFGYPNITQWNPAQPLPASIDVDHKNRNSSYAPQELPPWFKYQLGGEGPQNRSVVFVRSFVGQNQLPPGHPLAGPGGPPIRFVGPYSGPSQPTFLNGHTRPMCEEVNYSPSPSLYPLTQNALNDFPPDQRLLACVLTSAYHNGRHVAIGGNNGDMSFTDSAPRDPIFWKFHKFIDNVSVQRFFPFFAPLITAHAVAPGAVISNLGVDTVAPRIISQNPFRLYPYITSLPKISDKESALFGVTGVTALSAEFSEPVTGVKPSDFTVNGSPATQVSGTGAGPYVFIGFKSPGLGPINVTVSSGNISDISGNRFDGSSWKYILVKSNVDRDRDGLEDGLEANLFKTNPTKSDSDGDGISDGIEATSKCLNPQANDAMLMDMSMNIINKTGIDTDRDNKTNVQEIKDKTDPCIHNRSLPRGSFFDSLILSRNSSFARTQNMDGKNMTEDLTKTTTMTNPFILVMKKTESNGTNSSNNQLEYNAFTKKATFVINGTTTNRELSVSDENVVRRILNDSGFLDSKSFYPPSQAPNLSGSEYTLITILNGKIHAVYWTDNSPHVPNGLKNLPFILVSTMGDAKLTW